MKNVIILLPIFLFSSFGCVISQTTKSVNHTYTVISIAQSTQVLELNLK